VRRILAELEFPTLTAVGVTESDLDGLTEGALADYFISVAPAPWSPAEVRAAYAQGLALGARG
jgi:alcohol dehydrogenase